MKTDWRAEAPHWTILAAMFILAAVTWPTAPERIPVHWNLAGEVDRYGGRLEGLLALPLVALGVYVLLLCVPRIDPGRANYSHFRNAFTIVRIAILLMLAGVYVLVHLTMRGRNVDMAMVMPIMIGMLFIVFGGLMGKLRPNWFVGIRTPWTLSSKMAWVRTHRIGGWLFVVFGAAILTVTPLISPRAGSMLMIGGAVAIGVWSFVYSYLVWRQDPHKVPPAGTLPADESPGT